MLASAHQSLQTLDRMKKTQEKMEEEYVEMRKEKGLQSHKKYKEPFRGQASTEPDVLIENGKGAKICPERILNKTEMLAMYTTQKEEELQFRQEIQTKKQKLDIIALQALIEKNRIQQRWDQKVQDSEKNFLADEVEDEILRRYRDARDYVETEKDSAKYRIRRRGVMDPMLRGRQAKEKSQAEQPRVWKGEEGRFDKDDLVSWFGQIRKTRIFREISGEFFAQE